MAAGLRNSSLTRVRPFFEALIERDETGASWLADLLAATPHGERLGDNLTTPGLLEPLLPGGHVNRLLSCFEYPVHPPRSLLGWLVENPDELRWPRRVRLAEQTIRRRCELVCDEPSGARIAAQRDARALAATRPTSAREWWRFEGTSMIDCVLITDRLVVTVEGKRTEPLSPSTDWYPKRSQLVRNLEAAMQLADGRAWASVLVSEDIIPEGGDGALAESLPVSAPHLSAVEQAELGAHYLGNISWRQACQATGIAFDSLPKTIRDLE